MQPVTAFVVDFSQYDSGVIIDSEYAVNGADNTNSNLPSNIGFTVTVTSNPTNAATLYNSEIFNGADPDLEGGPDGNSFVSGNLVGHPQGNVLIIQENASPQELANGELTFSDGYNPGPDNVRDGNEDGPGSDPEDENTPGSSASGALNAPDDDGGGGTITFSFNIGLKEFGFNWVDLDGETYIVTFTNTLLNSSVSLNFDSFTDSNSDFYDSTVSFGDTSANTIMPISIWDIYASDEVSWSNGQSPQYFDEVSFSLSGSGGISQLNFSVPEAGNFVFGLLLLGFVAGARHYHSKP